MIKGVKWTGGQKFASDLARRATQMLRAQEAAVYEFGEEEMTESKKLVPVDTGELRASGHVEKPKRSGSRITVELRFGGGAITYAMTVHEDLEAFHPVGQAKYLEQPLTESAPFAPIRIAAKINEKLR